MFPFSGSPPSPPLGARPRNGTAGSRLPSGPAVGEASRVTPTSFSPRVLSISRLSLVADLATAGHVRAFKISLPFCLTADLASPRLLRFGFLRCDIETTQGGSTSLSGAPGVGWPGGRRGRHCGPTRLRSAARAPWSERSSRAWQPDPSGGQECLCGQQGLRTTVRQQGWGHPNILAATSCNY